VTEVLLSIGFQEFAPCRARRSPAAFRNRPDNWFTPDIHPAARRFERIGAIDHDVPAPRQPCPKSFRRLISPCPGDSACLTVRFSIEVEIFRPYKPFIPRN